MTASNHYTTVLRELPPDSVIITPNRRLALSLHKLYQRFKIEEGADCWATPVILPANVWIDTLWTDYARKTLSSLPHILNPAQEQQLWESILHESAYHDYFLQISETSRLVKSARGLLKQWQVSTDHPLFETADDYRACRQWLEKFDAICREQNWTDNASLSDLVLTAMHAGEIPAPNHLYYAGFTDLSPQLSALLSACPHVEVINPDHPAAMISRTSAADTDDELRLCARWAKAQHAQHPDHNIGCVIPLLDKKRDRVIQLFSEVFTSTDDFNISAGQPLAQYPVIHAAIECLGLYKRQISTEALFYILSTPFIGGGETERIKRSQFDGRLRGKNYSVIDLDKQLIKTTDSHQPNLATSCPILAKRIRQFKELLEDTQHTAPYAFWAALFNQLLTALGWPGERIINSEEYQVVDEWLKLLNDLTTLDVTSPPVMFYQALRMLSQMAGAKPFQPKSPAANVQILGVLEAGGLAFDHLWVSGLDDQSWPSQPKPNPFIPKKLQRDLKMPHASAERELEYCQSMTQQFTHSATHVVFSYARKQDETQVQPSPLIKSFPHVSVHDIISVNTPPLAEIIYQHQALEQIIDEVAPPIQAGEQTHGGVSIIKNQALCPFKAFAESRLMARELESTLPGIRPVERGNIVHDIMQKCWESLQTSDQLQQMTDDTLRDLLTKIIDEALLEHASAQAHQSGYLALEKQRLLKLMLDWLMLEKERPPFTVTGTEQSAEIKLNQLTLNVRIDRIDTLENGQKLIIDYKTGTNQTLGDWLGRRPEAPQLPLYAQLDQTGTAGIAFAQIAAGKHKFIGLSRRDLGIKGIHNAEETKSTDNQTWDELTESWISVMTQLGDDYYQGKAYVDPKQKQTCQRCALKPLCRIHQDSGDDENDDE